MLFFGLRYWCFANGGKLCDLCLGVHVVGRGRWYGSVKEGV